MEGQMCQALDNVSNVVGGRIKNHLSFWETITNDRIILDYVKGVKIEFDNFPVLYNHPIVRFSDPEHKLIDLEMGKFLSSGIIEEVTHCSGEYISHIFSVPKKSEGVRIILNLKPLNRNVTYSHFKMEHLGAALGLIEQNCCMASIDLKDAYYSVNVHDSHRKFLRFFLEWKIVSIYLFSPGLK